MDQNQNAAQNTDAQLIKNHVKNQEAGASMGARTQQCERMRSKKGVRRSKGNKKQEAGGLTLLNAL